MSKELRTKKRIMSSELERLTKEISEIQSDGVKASTDLLEKNKLRDIGKIENTISDAMHILGKLSVKKDGKATGIMKSLLGSIPFSDRIMKKVESSVIENKSMKECVDDMHDAIDNSIETMMDDLDGLIKIHDHISDSLEKGIEKELLLSDFVKKATEDERRMDVIHGKRLLTQLKAINITNKESINGLSLQIQSSEQMAGVLSQILPVLKPALLQQSSIAVAQINNERVLKTQAVVSKVLNEVIVSNKEGTNETIKNTIKLSNTKIIDADTIKKLGSLSDVLEKDLKALASKMRKEDKEYEKVLTESQAKLLSHSNDFMLELDSSENEGTH